MSGLHTTMSNTRKVLLICYVLVVTGSLPAAISLDAPGHVYADNETPIARGGVSGSSYTLTDWRGRAVGRPAVWGECGTAVLPRLPVGYYHLKSEDEDATFAVVPEVKTRVFDHDSFYGIDSAQSWISRKGSFVCPWNSGDTYRTVSDLIRLSGLPHVRDRLSWEEVNPQPEKFDYSYYMYNADLLRERGILISGMFHDCPKWAGKLKKLPSDLNAVYAFCAQTAAAFGDRMGDWEFWNEEDILFAPEPVWDYAAALKAAYLGFKSGLPGITVLPGAICQDPDSDYVRVLFENDAVKFFDVFNYHTYDAPVNYPRRFAALRKCMECYGIAERAVWMTESGTDLEGHSTRAGAKKGLMAHSPEQELVKAEFYPKSQIAFQMEGVARNYYFVFGAYNERKGVKDWGVMRRDGTVKPEYATISTMTRELVSARLIGEMDVGEGLRAYLFDQLDGSQTVVYWSVSPLDTSGGGVVQPIPDFARQIVISAEDGTYRLSDLCGTMSTASARNGVLKLEATRFPAYVAGLHGLSVKTKARPKGRVMPYVPKADEDMTVILRVDLNTNDFAITGQKTRAVLRNDTGRMRVQVWNMGEVAKAGRVEVEGGTFKGLPDRIVLGPRGTPPVSLNCTFLPYDDGVFERNIVLTGVFNGKRSSRVALPMRLEKSFLSTCEITPLAYNTPKDWERNTSAETFNVAWDEAEQAIRFDFEWRNQDVDRWFYPVYRLKLPAESLSGARMLQFDVKSAQNKVENDFATQNLMLLFKDGSVRRIPYHAPLGSWEKRNVELVDGDTLADVVAFRLGANPKGTRCTFWIRNLAILKEKGK